MSFFSPTNQVGAKHPRLIRKGSLFGQRARGSPLAPPLPVGGCEGSIMAGLGQCDSPLRAQEMAGPQGKGENSHTHRVAPLAEGQQDSHFPSPASWGLLASEGSLEERGGCLLSTVGSAVLEVTQCHDGALFPRHSYSQFTSVVVLPPPCLPACQGGNRSVSMLHRRHLRP